MHDPACALLGNDPPDDIVEVDLADPDSDVYPELGGRVSGVGLNGIGLPIQPRTA